MEIGRAIHTADYSYNSFDPLTMTAISQGLSGLGQGVAGVFGFLSKKKDAELLEQQAQYDAYMELQKKKRTTNIVLGAVSLIAITVGAIVIIKKVR